MIATVAMVGVIATQSFYSDVLDEMERSVTDASDEQPAESDDPADSEDSVEAAQVAGPDTESAPEEPNPAADEATEESDASSALGLGATADVGAYAVTVTDAQLDATEAVTSANSFNDDPTGQYVLVTLDVTYTGDGEGNPWLDLSVQLAGSDARVYDTSSCEAVPPNSPMDLPTLTTGGQGSFDVCFDVPTDALDDPKIYVEESFSFSDTRVTWGMDQAAAADVASTADTEQEEKPSTQPPADALEVGDTAEVGEYAVTVTDVQLEANDALKSANTFNDDPSGQYVLVTLDVTYNGDEEGDAWLDLSVELAGSDARIYDSSSCMAVTPHPVMDVPTLTNGGQASFDTCFDIPEDALDNPVIFVEELLSFDDARAAWKTTS